MEGLLFLCYAPHQKFRMLGLIVKPSSSFGRDFFQMLFSSRRLFETRFFDLPSRRIFLLGFFGVFFGLLVGSLINVVFSRAVLQDFAKDAAPYASIIESLGLSAQSFVELLKAQQAYSLMIALFSPVIAYVAPHLFGGALYLFLWLLYRPQQFSFHRVMECSALSLTSVAYYVVPGLGPLIAIISVGINTSRALAAQYKLIGFLKIMAIISAMYLCFFLTSATFQLLAQPFAEWLEQYMGPAMK